MAFGIAFIMLVLSVSIFTHLIDLFSNSKTLVRITLVLSCIEQTINSTSKMKDKIVFVTKSNKDVITQKAAELKTIFSSSKEIVSNLD